MPRRRSASAESRHKSSSAREFRCVVSSPLPRAKIRRARAALESYATQPDRYPAFGSSLPSNEHGFDAFAGRPRRGALIAPSRCGRSAPHRARGVANAEGVRSPEMLSHCHGQGWQRRGATAARGRYHTAPPWFRRSRVGQSVWINRMRRGSCKTSAVSGRDAFTPLRDDAARR